MTLNRKILKVCRVDSINFASFAVKQNVEFLGVHVLDERNIGEHVELVDYINNSVGKSILVTKIQKIDALLNIVEIYKPAGLQLHFEIHPHLVSLLRTRFPNLLIFGVLTNNTQFLDFAAISRLFDYLIYDTSYKGGTNETNSYIYYEKFPQNLKAKTLLAGGIDSDRIKELNSLEAGGYDIQSYFRSGECLSFKNLDKICDLLKFPRRSALSISLTDIPLHEIHRVSTYYRNSNLEYHLDFSLGSLYPSFNTIGKSIEEKQKSLVQLPYSIHLFIKNEDEIQQTIDKLVKKHPLNLIRIFVQYFEGMGDYIFSSNSEVKIIPSVLFKDLASYFTQAINASVLSIVVPDPLHKSDVEAFITTYIAQAKNFEGKEVWLDRNLEPNYIQLLQKHLGNNFNFIIGKGVINDWSKINSIHELILKQK
jgi:phosphoribosylanthranilate isomerase